MWGAAGVVQGWVRGRDSPEADGTWVCAAGERGKGAGVY